MSKRTVRSPAMGSDASVDILAQMNQDLKRKNRQNTPNWVSSAAAAESSTIAGTGDSLDMLSSNQRAFAARFSATPATVAGPLDADHDFLADFDFHDALMDDDNSAEHGIQAAAIDLERSDGSSSSTSKSSRSKSSRKAKEASRGNRKTKRHAGGGRWTKDEDEKLRDAIKRFGAHDWEAIANAVGNNRSDSQCSHRWQKVLEPGLVKGPWTKEEDDMIRQCIDEGVMKWSEIAERIPGRIGKQCRERWFNHLDPTLKKGGWTEEEDAILVEAQSKWGNSWTKIAKLLPGRSENAVKNRWNSATRRRAKQQQSGAGPHAGESARAKAAITVMNAEKSGILDEANTNIHPGAIRAQQLQKEGKLPGKSPSKMVERLRKETRDISKGMRGKVALRRVVEPRVETTAAAVIAAARQGLNTSQLSIPIPDDLDNDEALSPITSLQPTPTKGKRYLTARKKALRKEREEVRGPWSELEASSSFSENNSAAVNVSAHNGILEGPQSSTLQLFDHEGPLSLSNSLMQLSLDPDMDAAMFLDEGINYTPKKGDALRSPLNVFLTKEARLGAPMISPAQSLQYALPPSGKARASGTRRSRPDLSLDIGQIDSSTGALPSPASTQLMKLYQRLAMHAHTDTMVQSDEMDQMRREIAELTQKVKSPDRMARTLSSRGVDLSSPRMARAMQSIGLSPKMAILRKLIAAQQLIQAQATASEHAEVRSNMGRGSPSSQKAQAASIGYRGVARRRTITHAETPAPTPLMVDSTELLEPQLELSQEVMDFVHSPNLLWSVGSSGFDAGHGGPASVAAK